MITERMAWWGNCRNDDCAAQIVVAASDDTDDAFRRLIADGPDEWDWFSACPVCDSHIDWNGSDPLPLTIR